MFNYYHMIYLFLKCFKYLKLFKFHFNDKQFSEFIVMIFPYFNFPFLPLKKKKNYVQYQTSYPKDPKTGMNNEI